MATKLKTPFSPDAMAVKPHRPKENQLKLPPLHAEKAWRLHWAPLKNKKYMDGSRPTHKKHEHSSGLPEFFYIFQFF